MASQTRRQSIRAVVVVVTTVAILVSLRSIYQEMRRQEAAEQMEAMERAAPPPPGWEREAERARQSVAGQLNAFKAGDWKKAFTFAAASFHEQMALADFRQMVEDGFPQIARPREIRLGEGQWNGGEIGVAVTVTGKDGVTAHYVYLLAKEEDEWKVAGVHPSAPPSETAPEGTAPSAPEKDAPAAPTRPAPPTGAA